MNCWSIFKRKYEMLLCVLGTYYDLYPCQLSREESGCALESASLPRIVSVANFRRFCRRRIAVKWHCTPITLHVAFLIVGEGWYLAVFLNCLAAQRASRLGNSFALFSHRNKPVQDRPCPFVRVIAKHLVGIMAWRV